MCYLCAPPCINVNLLHAVKSVMAINQEILNTMADNCQWVGDCKYHHLQDAWKDWSEGRKLVPVYYKSLKRKKLIRKKYAAFNF